jgi:hypothetical protein
MAFGQDLLEIGAKSQCFGGMFSALRERPPMCRSPNALRRSTEWTQSLGTRSSTSYIKEIA